MTDKEKIREEVKKIQNGCTINTDFSIGLKNILGTIISYIDSLPEEPISEELEEELNNWRHQHFHGRRDKNASGEYLERMSQLDLANHFANWQKQKMMKNAIDAEVEQEYYNPSLSLYIDTIYVDDRTDLKRGDKVKLIIVKNDRA